MLHPAYQLQSIDLIHIMFTPQMSHCGHFGPHPSVIAVFRPAQIQHTSGVNIPVRF